MLYQRYFLRMNQSNTTHILSLLLALVLSLAAVHIILIPMESTSHSNKMLQRNRYNDTVNSNGSHNGASFNRSDSIANYTPTANSQQHFVRLNYNYSTDNETGNCLFPYCLGELITVYVTLYTKYVDLPWMQTLHSTSSIMQN